MGKGFDITSSALVLLLFVVVIYVGILFSRKVSETKSSASDNLKARGVDISDGKISVKTDRPAMTREQQVESTQAAVGAAARYVAERKDAISVGESPSQRGFRRTKKLD